MNPSSSSKAIGLLAYDDMQALDLTGPLDVFGAANALASGMPPYELHVIGVYTGAVHAENGLAMLPACSIEDAPPRQRNNDNARAAFAEAEIIPEI